MLSVKQGSIKYHFFEFLVTLDLGLYTGLPDHWRRQIIFFYWYIHFYLISIIMGVLRSILFSVLLPLWYLIKNLFLQITIFTQNNPLLREDRINSEHWQLGLAVRVFANGPGDLGSIPRRVIPKTQKMVLDAPLLNTQHYKVRIKGKVEQSWEGVAPPYTLV